MTSSDESLPPVARVTWDKTYRLIPSRYPPVDLFERIAPPGDWEVLAEIEGLTNDRLRNEIGQISLVDTSERVVGPGATPIMAAFTYIGFPSRFTDGSFGVYYASDQLEAALYEVLYHKARFLLSTAEAKTRLDLRAYIGQIDCDLYDARDDWPSVHDPSSYEMSQALAKRVRSAKGNGIVFNSVRKPPSQNIAIFRPSVLKAGAGTQHTIQGPHIHVEWDGSRMSRYIIVGEPNWKAL